MNQLPLDNISKLQAAHPDNHLMESLMSSSEDAELSSQLDFTLCWRKLVKDHKCSSVSSTQLPSRFELEQKRGHFIS